MQATARHPLSLSPSPQDADEAMAALSAFVNESMAVLRTFRFQALPPDLSLQDAPTYAVEMYGSAGQLAATYKFNYFLETAPAGTASWHLFPLVIQWNENGAYRTAGMDGAIIEHCLSSLRAFFSDDLRSGAARLTMASGYLTTQRQGRAFFERLGWRLHSFSRQNGDYPALIQHPAPLQAIARRIDEISMPFRTEDIEANLLCFAVMDIEA